jgi:ribosomal protein L37AE/L43A
MLPEVSGPNGGAQSLSERRERKFANPLDSKTQIEREIEKTVSDLLVGKEAGEPIKIGKKIVKTLDEDTKIEYELVVNRRTGQQETVEHIISDRKQCSVCHANLSRSCIYTCELCGKQVCGREYGSIQVIEDYRHVVYDDWNDQSWGEPKRKSREDPIYKTVSVCSNCYFDRTGKRFEQ